MVVVSTEAGNSWPAGHHGVVTAGEPCTAFCTAFLGRSSLYYCEAGQLHSQTHLHSQVRGSVLLTASHTACFTAGIARGPVDWLKARKVSVAEWDHFTHV